MIITSFINRTGISYLAARISYLVFLTSYLLLAGCDETGEAMNSPAIGSLSFRAYTTDPLSFNVYINGKLMGAKKQFKYYGGTVRLTIDEVVSGRVIFDGDYAVHSSGGTSVLVTVYQSRSGSVPFCLLPPVDEPAPPAGYSKVAFIYNLSDLPDSLKAVIENTTTATSNVYVPTDSLIVMKNQCSGFFLSRYGQKKVQVRLYTAGDERKPVGVIESSKFYDISKAFSIYLANTKSAATIPSVGLEKIY